MPDEQPKPDSGLENELMWVLRRIRILLSCWTTPLTYLQPDTFSRDDGVAARAFALFLIVALAFAVRGDPGSSDVFTTIAGATGILLSVVLNATSRSFSVTIREPIVISAYASTIIVMAIFVLFDSNAAWKQYLEDEWGETGRLLITSLLAAVAAFAFLLIKSKFWDKHQIGAGGAVHGLLVTLGSGAIVFIIAILSSPIFKMVLDLLGRKR